MPPLPFHFISDRGGRPYMEDAYVIPDHRGNFFAVFDGHGGDKCSQFCASEVRDIFFDILEESEDGYILSVFEAVFRTLQDRLRAVCRFSGTTATMMYITDQWVHTANVGDSDAVMWREDSLTMLTDTHRAGLDPAETHRVENSGGVITGNRVNCALSVTRALGDISLMPAVSSKPTLTSTRIRDSDKFIVIATDGLWDAIPAQRIPESVVQAENDLAHMAACLGEKCSQSRDNYTVGIIDLRRAQTPESTGGYTFSKQFQLHQQMTISKASEPPQAGAEADTSVLKLWQAHWDEG